MIRDKVYWQTKQSSSWVPEQAWLASRLHTWGRRRVLGHKKTCPVFWWCYHKKWQFLVKIQAGDPRFFRPSATVSRIGVTSASLSWRTPPPAGWSPWLAGYPPHGMDGWGARPLRWLSLLVARQPDCLPVLICGKGCCVLRGSVSGEGCCVTKALRKWTGALILQIVHQRYWQCWTFVNFVFAMRIFVQLWGENPFSWHYYCRAQLNKRKRSKPHPSVLRIGCSCPSLTVCRAFGGSLSLT